MFKILKVVVGMSLVGCLVWCKLQPVQDVQSIITANDELKIAANYLGDVRCRAYLQAQGRAAAEIDRIIDSHVNFTSHKLGGMDGELITKQFKVASDKPQAQLSGDRFLSRDSNAAFAMEDIEANCRRLVFSIDSHASPTLTLTHAQVVRDQQQLFAQDFGQQGFGTLHCGGNFCTFSNIKGIRGSTRYFVLLEPAKGHPHIQVGIGYYPHDTTKLVNLDKIELENIYFRDKSRYQMPQSPSPTPNPALARDPHLSYVRDLYVSYAGGDNLFKFPDDTRVQVSLQVRDGGGVVRKRLLADRGIEIHNTDPRKRVASLNVNDICANFIAASCGEQLEKFASLLLSTKAELTMEFKRQQGQQLIFTHRQPLTPELLDNMSSRQGTLAVQGEGWVTRFDFSNKTASELHLYFDWSPPNDGFTPRYIYLDPALGCGDNASTVKNKFYTLPPQGVSTYNHLKIDISKMLAYFRKQPCLQPSARGTGDQQFLKKLRPTLVFHNAPEYAIDRGVTFWRYALSDEDIDAWFAARGGIVIPPVPSASNSKPAPVLKVGFQKRR